MFSTSLGFGSKDGRLYEPRQVPLGKACGCVCPGCGAPLVAKHCLSGKVRPYFAHGSLTDCSGGAETALHAAAKQVILDALAVYLPVLEVCISGKTAVGNWYEHTQLLVPGGIVQFDEVLVERKIKGVVPDLIGCLRQRQLLIEIAVTHFMDEDKLARIRDLGLACVEFDLSDLPRDSSLGAWAAESSTSAVRKTGLSKQPTSDFFEGAKGSSTPETAAFRFNSVLPPRLLADLRRALLADSRRPHWRHHPRQEHVHDQLMRQVQPLIERDKKIYAERQASAVHNRTLEESQREHQKQREAVQANAFQALSNEQKLAFSLRQMNLPFDGPLPYFLNLSVRHEDEFGVPRSVWQAAIFGCHLNKCRDGMGPNVVHPELLVSWLWRQLGLPPFATNRALQAMCAYLRSLVAFGVLVQRNNRFIGRRISAQELKAQGLFGSNIR